jgi:hypothetical protein
MDESLEHVICHDEGYMKHASRHHHMRKVLSHRDDITAYPVPIREVESKYIYDIATGKAQSREALTS